MKKWKKLPGDSLGLYMPPGWMERLDGERQKLCEWAGGISVSRNRFVVALISIGLEAGYDRMLTAVTNVLQDQARKAYERAIRRMGVKHETEN